MNSSAAKPIRIDLNIGDQLTSISCGHIVVEFVKFIAYQRLQIPYTYQWLKQMVNKRKSSEEKHKNESLMAERHFRVASTALENLDFIIKSLLQEITSASLPEEVCISLGASPIASKEVYRLLLPSMCHKPQCHSKTIASDQKIQLNVFRELVTSEKLSQVFSNQLTPTNFYVMIKKKMASPNDTVLNHEHFTLTSGHRIPRSAKIIIIDLRNKAQASGQLPEMPIYLAALIMCSGFFMMYLVEELVHVYINSRENSNANTSFTRVLSIRRNNDGEVAKDEESKSPDHKGHVHGHSHLHTEGADDSIVAALRGLLIVLALSIHELFEGLAVGLESSANKVWFMFGAVSAHKYIIAFCIGVELLVAGTRRWLSILYIFTFSFVSALGIGVGILLVGGAGAAQAGLYSVVLQGLACGTLVYVVFFEVWRQDRTGLLQFVCSVLGFALMVALELVVELAA